MSETTYAKHTAGPPEAAISQKLSNYHYIIKSSHVSSNIIPEIRRIVWMSFRDASLLHFRNVAHMCLEDIRVLTSLRLLIFFIKRKWTVVETRNIFSIHSHVACFMYVY